MIRYKQLFHILDKPLLLSFHSFESYILDYLSSVGPWSRLSKVVAKDTLRV